jgi:hypothetical protein
VTNPTHAVTTDDGRYYIWPKTPDIHYPSITTIIKQGVPKPFMVKWAAKRAAEQAVANLDILVALRERAHADS